MNEYSVGTAGSLGTATPSTVLFLNPPTAQSRNVEFMRFWLPRFARKCRASRDGSAAR